MGWAVRYIEKLRRGERVIFRPRGNSMSGKIESGQLCTVDPVDDPKALMVGDRKQPGRVNGWVGPSAIYGKCVSVVD